MSPPPSSESEMMESRSTIKPTINFLLVPPRPGSTAQAHHIRRRLQHKLRRSGSRSPVLAIAHLGCTCETGSLNRIFHNRFGPIKATIELRCRRRHPK
jgi:hypothetical protein